MHDIGMRIHGDDDRPEDALIDIYAGGGLGRTPVLGALIREKLPAKDLLTYTEAYSVVAAMLARKEAYESLEEAECIADALTYGRQVYLQRRISSESSIGKLLFKNAYKMLQSRQLTEGGADDLKEKRLEVARELREMIRRIDVIRAIGVANSGSV